MRRLSGRLPTHGEMTHKWSDPKSLVTGFKAARFGTG